MIGIANAIGFKSGFSWSSYWEENTDLWIKSRSDLTLTDDYGNNTSLLTPVIITDGASNEADSGVKAYENTVWVLRAKINSTAQYKFHGAPSGGASTRFFIGTGSTTNKLNCGWGNTTAVVGNNQDNDFAWHTFILYDKRLWILAPTVEVTDAAILNVINTVAPDINIAAATWTGTEQSLYYGSTNGGFWVDSNIAFSYIGRITAGVITWSRKHIFGGIRTYSYDILDKDNYVTWSNTANLVDTFSLYGSTHFLDIGYSLYIDDAGAGSRRLVPYLESGSAMDSPDVQAGYSLFANYTGNSSKLYIDDCILRITGDFFDRSDTDIYKDAARGTFYDSGNVTDWRGFEFNRIKFEEYINDDYKYKPFTRYNEVSEINYPTEIILAKTNQLSNKSGVFGYCNDYDTAYTITQLTRHIDHQNGSKIFGYESGNMFYSSDNGSNYTDKVFADALDIGMSFIFDSGVILFVTDENAYVSTDGLLTYEEISIYDQNGDAFPTRAGIKNFLNVRFVDSQTLANGKQMITWGSYINVTDDGYVALFYCIEGESIQTAYMFGQNATYGSYGDATNPIIARHIHSSVYSPDTGKWYWNTGDHGTAPDVECHIFESSYNYLTNVWTNTLLLSSDDTSHVKAGALNRISGNVYLGSDSTSDTAERGMWKVPEANLGTLADHLKIFNHSNYILSGHIELASMGIVFPAGVPYDAGKYHLINFNKYRAFNYQVKTFEITPAQTDPNTYIAWKLIKVSNTIILASPMLNSTQQYTSNTVKITLI